MNTLYESGRFTDIWPLAKELGERRILPPAIRLKHGDGNIALSDEEVNAVFKEYWQTLLNRENSWNAANLAHEFSQLQISGAVPTMSELSEAIQRSPRNKAPGDDGIPIEAWIMGGCKLRSALLSVITAVWAEKQIPGDWKHSSIHPLYKGKGCRQTVDNYRGISLLSTAGKLFARIIAQRIKRGWNTFLPREKCAYRKGRSALENVFIIQQALQKGYEKGVHTRILLMDLKAAFDLTPRKLLWETLLRIKTDTSTLRLIKTSTHTPQPQLQMDQSSAFGQA